MSDIHVGIVGGTRLPGNVRTFLSNIRGILFGHPQTFDLELILSGSVDVPGGYNQVDPGFKNTGRAVGTLQTLTSGLITYARQRDVDLLFQVTKFPLHGCAATVAGRQTNTPVLTRFAGDNFHEFCLSAGIDAVKVFGLNNVLGRVPVHWSDRVIVLGPHGHSEIRSRDSDVSIEEIPQPVAHEQFFPVSADREDELAQKLGFPKNERTLLTVGRLTKRKGMGTLIKTAEELSAQGEAFHWYVLGDGPMYDELASTRSVKPLGRINFEKIADYYRAADLVVHPSLIEGLPNVLLEAAACGTATIARNVGDSETVASATFETDDELLALLADEFEPVSLGVRFDPAQLREQYGNVLIKTAQKP